MGKGGGGIPVIVPHMLSSWQKVLIHIFYGGLMKAWLQMRRLTV